MSRFCRSEKTARILLMVCLWGVFPMPTKQFPIRDGFLMLYPVSVMGPYGPQTVLLPVSSSEPNSQRQQTSPANHTEVPSQGLSGAAPDPAPSPAPVIQTGPSESSVLQGQMSNLLPSNIPLQVYSFVQQAVIADSGSSEEGEATQVIYMVPISVNPPSMGVMEGSVPNPDPGHLHVAGSTSSTPTAAPPQARGQLANTVVTEATTRTDVILAEETL